MGGPFFNGFLPLKYSQILHSSQHSLSKSLHNLKDFYLLIFSQMLFKVHLWKEWKKSPNFLNHIIFVT